jgi:hypothetical protein
MLVVGPLVPWMLALEVQSMGPQASLMWEWLVGYMLVVG